MNTIITLVVAVLPALVLWLYVWKKDARPEPAKELLKAIGWGFLHQDAKRGQKENYPSPAYPRLNECCL